MWGFCWRNPCCGGGAVSSSSALVQICSASCRIDVTKFRFDFSVSGVAGVFGGLIACSGFNRSWSMLHNIGCIYAETVTSPGVGAWSAEIGFPTVGDPTGDFMLRFVITPLGSGSTYVARYGPSQIPCSAGTVVFPLYSTAGCSGWPSQVSVSVVVLP